MSEPIKEFTTISLRKREEGEKLAILLGLPVEKSYTPPRWNMGEFGTKTGIGIYEVIQRLAEEAKKRVENSP